MSTEGTASEEQWHWSKKDSDERNGPVGRERLEKLAEDDDLGSEDLVWRKGFDDWKEAGSVEEIEDLFASPPPLPDDPSDEKGEEPPTLPQSKPDDDGKALKSEATSCVHDYDEDDICQKCGWSKTELKEIDRSKSEKDSTEKPLGGDSSQRIGSTESKDDPSTRLQSEPEDDESDGRYWYKKKRYAISFAFFLIPFFVWELYKKYFSSDKEKEWFENYFALLTQAVWFPPAGWYGLYHSSKISGRWSLLAGSLAPTIFLASLGMIINIRQVSNFKENREKIIGSLVRSENLEVAIDKAEKYEGALIFQEEKDTRLFEIADSLRREKAHRLISRSNDTKEAIEKVDKFKSTSKSEEKKDVGLSKLLDSLRKERVIKLKKKAESIALENREEKVNILEKAASVASKLDIESDVSESKIKNRIEEISETDSEEIYETDIPGYKKASCNTRDARYFIEESYGDDTRVKGWAASYMMSNCRYYAKALIINPSGKPIFHKITIDGSSGEWTLIDQEVEKF